MKNNNSIQQYSLVVYNKDDLDKIISYDNKRYAYILHDKDKEKDEQGNEQLKTPHYHVYISFNKKKRKNWLQWYKYTTQTEFIENVFCEQCKDLQGLLMYFVHYNDKEKYQYNKNDIKSNFVINFDTDNISQNDVILDSLKAIRDKNGIIGWTKLFTENSNLIFSAHSLEKSVQLMLKEKLYKDLQTDFDKFNENQKKCIDTPKQLIFNNFDNINKNSNDLYSYIKKP